MVYLPTLLSFQKLFTMVYTNIIEKNINGHAKEYYNQQLGKYTMVVYRFILGTSGHLCTFTITGPGSHRPSKQ